MKSELSRSCGVLITVVLGLWVPAVSAQVKSFVGGEGHALILKNGSVFAMGDNSSGQLGLGIEDTRVEYFQEIETGYDKKNEPFWGASVKYIAAGAWHSLAVDDNGGAWAWGNNAFGQLGVNAVGNHHSPILVDFPVSTVVEQMAGGLDHSVALDVAGVIWIWGKGNPTPQRLEGVPEITRIAAGDTYILALDVNGLVWTWGDITADRFGEINSPARYEPLPVDANGFGPIDKIAAGARHSLALDTRGRVWAWGSNSHGQLGDTSSTESVGTPQLIADLIDVNVIDIAAGANHCLALDSSSRVWAWGDYACNQLDKETTVPQTPSVVEALALYDVNAVSAGYSTPMVITKDGIAVYWGFDLIDACTAEPREASFTPCLLDAVYDEALEAAIKAELGIEDDPNRIALPDWLRLTSLDASGLGVKTVDMLDCARNLEVLILSNNNIEDISGLAKLTRLQVLDLNDNLISDANDNVIEDISAVAGLLNLTELWLEGNDIEDLSPLSELSGLVHLNLKGNQIKDITPLGGLTELYTLWLTNNYIETVRPLTALTHLYHLLVDGNMLGPDDEYDLAVLQKIIIKTNGCLWR